MDFARSNCQLESYIVRLNSLPFRPSSLSVGRVSPATLAHYRLFHPIPLHPPPTARETIRLLVRPSVRLPITLELSRTRPLSRMAVNNVLVALKSHCHTAIRETKKNIKDGRRKSRLTSLECHNTVAERLLGPVQPECFSSPALAGYSLLPFRRSIG